MQSQIKKGELPTPYQQFIHVSRYARWLPEKGRRETWQETVSRYINFICDHVAKNHNYQIDDTIKDELENAILNLEIMPSMRCMMTAGIALEKDHAAAYNCSYLSISGIRSFPECFYLLMCGCGVGFSVEKKYVDRLQPIPELTYSSGPPILIEDSKMGWVKAFEFLLRCMFVQGSIVKFDYSEIRKAGERLKTFGGRASGPEPLKDLFEFTIALFKNAQGRKLSSIECHDLVCKIASCVVVGGVRRSALISLTDLDDQEMRNAKSGNFWDEFPYRSYANNSAVYENKPSSEKFMEEWLSLIKSKCGERGIINRQAFIKKVENSGRRLVKKGFGCNPCAEIILRDMGFCNLSEVVVKPDDDCPKINRKIELATILGTIQSTFTDFRYLHSAWKDNCEEERLLGVSLTGIFDNQITYYMEEGKPNFALKVVLDRLRQQAVRTNQEWAKKLNINHSVAITTVKPSGTVSQLVDSSSGIHPRLFPYYWRTVRAANTDPICQFLIDSGVKYENCCTDPKNLKVFYFPQKSPEHSVLSKNLSAIQHLEIWKMYQDYYCEHKPSATIYVKDEEWMEVGSWVYKNFDDISGISFLPVVNHSYNQAPYIEITKEEYERELEKMPVLDWNLLSNYEKEDNTSINNEFCCSADGCEFK